MLTITLTVTPSLNKLHGNRWQMLNWKKKYLRELRGYEIYKLKKPVVMLISIIRHGSRLLDKDNLYGGFKPMIDAIKNVGLIVDDSQIWLKYDCVGQVKCKRGEEKTVVALLERKS